MNSDTFTRLEQQVDRLLKAYGELKAENETLRRELAEARQIVQETEAKKNELSTSIGSLLGDSEANEEKLQAAAEKLESIITRLESVG
ncbi:MAG: hypothetical protein GF331_09960 [Chitinivibrionales bacterium]|nr:hypothetical protein [Chitinivibrionales bacterium]